VIPLERDKIDCEAVNHNNQLDNNKRETECRALRCNYNEHNVCVSNIGNSCALRNDISSCLNHDSNYDPISEQNKCRWSQNYNSETNNLGDGYCTDTRMLQPCGLYDESNCPTEEKRDTMGNKIENSNHCKIEVNMNNSVSQCVNNINPNFNGTETFNHCHYDYLNTGRCDESHCEPLSLTTIDGSSLGEIAKCVPRERLPCSALTPDECRNSVIVGTGTEKICEFNQETDKCEIKETYESLITQLEEASDSSNAEYYEINQMKEKLDNVGNLIDENKQHYLKNKESIIGLITNIKKNDAARVQNPNKIVLTTNSILISKLAKNDEIFIKQISQNNSPTLSPSKNTPHTILDLDVVSKEITLDLDALTIDGNVITTTEQAITTLYWEIEHPSKGLFGSYQHAQTIMDAIKINDFYNNFF
jgi:hypothetical protein